MGWPKSSFGSFRNIGKCKGTSWPTISKLHKKVHLIYKDSHVPIYGTLMEMQT